MGSAAPSVHTPHQAGELAAAVAARPGFVLVGLVAYEAQVAVPDAGAGVGGRGPADAAPFSRSPGSSSRGGGGGERHAKLEFTTAAALAAGDRGGSDGDRGDGRVRVVRTGAVRPPRVAPRPAALFALPVVRRRPGVVTVAGGGWIASGPRKPAGHRCRGCRRDSA